MPEEPTKAQYAALTLRADLPLIASLEALANDSGATRHAVLVAAVRRGLPMLTLSELRNTLPSYRRRHDPEPG